MSQRKVQAGGFVRSSLDNTWQTPPEILERVRAYFGGPIPFDPATSAENPTEALSFCAGPPGTLFADHQGENGLEVSWLARCRTVWDEGGAMGAWVNPPYGRELRDWLVKIAAEARAGCPIVALLPATRWETDYLQAALAWAAAACFHRGRVSFVSSADGGRPRGNPSGSMILGWNVNRPRFARSFGPLGLVVYLEPPEEA